jgi:hypothetical protein
MYCTTAGSFGQESAIVEYQGQYVTQRIHFPIVATTFDDFGVLDLIAVNGKPASRSTI